VGKYLTTLTQFPLHNDNIPSSLRHLLKQSIIPLYLIVNLVFYTCVCIRSLTLYTGATTVLEMIPARPPEKKSRRYELDFVIGIVVILIFILY
jgi:hypothetical protein